MLNGIRLGRAVLLLRTRLYISGVHKPSASPQNDHGGLNAARVQGLGPTEAFQASRVPQRASESHLKVSVLERKSRAMPRISLITLLKVVSVLQRARIGGWAAAHINKAVGKG